MKPITIILAQQSKGCYYPEDDWELEIDAYSEKEIFESFKEGYLKDSMNRNDYPIVSNPIDCYSLNELDSEQQENWNNANIEFNKWKKRIQSLIPKIRKIRKIGKKEKYEKEKLIELAEKYDYLLIKKGK